MLISSLLWGICSSLDSGLLATAVKVSKSRHNSTIKLLIQNPPILFQDNTALSLHCTFQALIFSARGDMRTAISRNDSLTHKHMPPGLRPPRHNYSTSIHVHVTGTTHKVCIPVQYAVYLSKKADN